MLGPYGTWMGELLRALGAAGKKLSLALLREHVSQADGLWESLDLKWFLTAA